MTAALSVDEGIKTSTPKLILPPQHVLSVQDLNVHFKTSERDVHAVIDLNFHVKQGETLAIVGESGSGKSVTSLALMRLVEYGGGQITSGSMQFKRRDDSVLDLATSSNATMRGIRGADIAMIFQEPMTSLNPVFTAGGQIAEAIMIHQKKSQKEAMAEALRLLELVRIPDAKNVLKRYPHQLSGGMRQRVMIAMALSCRPRLLIADEPTTALDVTIQAQILELIRELQQEMQMGVVFITHDMGVVAEVADRVLVMFRGRGVEEGEASEIFTAPQHPYTQSLLAAVPKLGAMNGTDYPAKFELIGEKSLTAQEQVESSTAAKSAKEDEEVASVEENTARYDESPILRVQNLVTRFDIRGGLLNRVQKKVHAVEHINFDLYPGETLALVGESGCGKSTTGRSLLRLVDCQEGAIEFDGKNILELPTKEVQTLRRNIQFIFQDPFASLDPRLTVGFSVMEPLLIHGIAKGEEAQNYVYQLLERVGLPAEYAQRYPHEFSGGQRQRIAIARALALNPKVVVADESVSALDVSIQAQIINLMMDLQKELGVAFLFISHDMAVVERISHRVAVMYLGQIVEVGPRRAIFETPAHAYTKHLMSAVPVVDPSRRGRKRGLIQGEIPSPVFPINYEPSVSPLVEVGPNHFVAKHKISDIY